MIGYRVVPQAENDQSDYRFVDRWPEPDINEAAAAMRDLYEQPEAAAGLGARGRDFIHDYLHISHFREDIEKVMQGCNEQ